jgi:putative thioredoxin
MPIDVTDSNFDTEVLEKSKTTPVLVDFWAEWCGPCRMIGPVLERVEKEMGGRFVLAKLDTDHNQKTAGKYRISGIPAVKLFINGSVTDEFTGALPETHVKKFLENSLPNPELVELIDLSQADPSKAAEAVLERGLTGSLAEDILWKGVIEKMRTRESNSLLSIRAYIDAIPAVASRYSDARNHLLKFMDAAPSDEDLLHLGLVLTRDEERQGLDYFLSKVERADASSKAREKEAILVCFFLLGNSNPLVGEYRRKLASLLF